MTWCSVKYATPAVSMAERSADVRARVDKAWQRQLDRQGVANARLAQDALQTHCALSAAGQALLTTAIDRLGLSAAGLTSDQTAAGLSAAGVSAVPDSARVVQMVGHAEDPHNHLLMHAIGPNVSGVIGSAIVAGRPGEGGEPGRVGGVARAARRRGAGPVRAGA